MMYAMMRLLERLGILGIAYSVYLNSKVLNPVVLVRYLRSMLADSSEVSPRPPLLKIGYVSRVSEVQFFLRSGKILAETIENLFAKNSIDLRGKTVLDFGCGLGRVLRYFRGKAVLYGTDYNRKLIEWCRRNFPFAKFSTNALEPPTEFAGESFDIIYAVSVLTHLPEKLQAEWIEEFSRLLKPSGHLLVTTHGEGCIHSLTPAELAQFRTGRLVVRWPQFAGTNLCAAFHPRPTHERLFGDRFTELEFVPRGVTVGAAQDILLLTKNSKK